MPAQLKRRLFVFLFLVLLVALGFLAQWFFHGRFYESTDNAYVQGEITRVSSQLGARIDEVLVQDNQHVEKGQLLIRLEGDDFQLAVDRANATLATREAERLQAQSKLTQQASLIAAGEAQVASSQASLGRSQLDLSRAQTLRKPGYVSEERVTTLSADTHIARSQVAKAQADLQGQRQQVNALSAEIKRLDAQIANARTDLAQAELNLTRSEIHAPISGLIGQRAARNGQYVQAGAYLLSIVPDQDIWVQANFKETQIGHMQPGQKAELRFDAYSDTPIEARVDSLFAASGAQFSLLPPDNATGNFTKVVQRIPVKLTFAADNPLHGKIRPGMSVTVKVNIQPLTPEPSNDGR
ncbi:membrane fusion protein, multidrug efflux system [Pseudomonas chlororaphis]|uniref:HlyD family secretion protein n=1 Tax=Pseudomonas chlororaphis TaxID=587753 RepID=UPI00087B4B8A|nr:HlyD family secretion protein [Pseudomonas chlororaphis]AZD21345.1 Membrane fusion component of MSF-type tripartite multidrug efflux system [Pseudomonas chlororaphis subsp. aurantiaca]AZD53891.1 Membrane fusion component of MSF-type tripartite multidrug efflux system [Pseudomonas chlororaphis subsp. aurantiaca]AZD59988.1 Membrane fusion component of MSF-type tripartite multidrug efflux system [Pseudomonas chlororaphis subsp. aurantiaca]AZD65917.1 Membrane fusion component of MSF-type tripart